MGEHLRPGIACSLDELSPKELITPNGVKERVMEFFQGVDLEQVGEKNVGLVTIKTESYPNLPEMRHQARLNGFLAAEYSYILCNAALEQLQEGEYRRKALYILRGFTDYGDVSVTLIEYEGKAAEMRVDISPSAVALGIHNYSSELNERTQRSVCELLGIKI